MEGGAKKVQAKARVLDDWTIGIEQERQRLRKEEKLEERKSSDLRRHRRMRAETHQANFRKIEDELFQDAAAVIRGGLRAIDLETEAEGPLRIPPEWIQQFGDKEAKRMFRAAKYALNNAREAPVLLKIASDTFSGIAKARATEKSGPKTLNMVVAEMPSVDLPVYGSIVVDE